MEQAPTLNPQTPATPAAPSPPPSPRSWYGRIPLYVKILIALILGVIVGVLVPPNIAKFLDQPARLILRLLGAIAPPLILVAVVRALLGANVKGRTAGRMFGLLALNTMVAIIIGITVANVVRPGRHASLPPGEPLKTKGDPIEQLLDNIPSSVLAPLVNNQVIGVIFIAVTFALAARRLDERRRDQIMAAVVIGFDLILIVLHWIIALVPIAVFCKVAYVVGTQGFAPFKALGWFIVAVILALMLQSLYYLTRVKLSSWVPPIRLIRGTRDALAMAFSTGSSTATMPVTYANLVTKVGLRPQNASLGALVGSNFNNDGTALYEAMAALFIAQMTGTELTITQQILVIATSVVASVGAAGIPEAGLVTMTLVFNAVGLPIGYIALLLPVDWFLDRCRTMVNVMGDMNVSCILDGKTPHEPEKVDAELTAVV
jgi:DAACS family dicarboxylate/amino acid:cation (Na+ or H+) symporter